MSKRSRTIGINIRVTEQEKKRIIRNAKKCKLGMSEYLRQLANGHDPQELPNDRMYDLCWQIELLIDEFGRQKDEKFKSYLTGMLSDLQKICHGQKKLTETELIALGIPADNGVSTFGNDQDLAGT